MPHSILLIEDDPDIMQVVQYELTEAGYEVFTAPDGLTGLTLAREHSPDLVILDLGLPDFDGAEIARRLRKTSTSPVIVLTAMDSYDRKLNLLEAGADDYMTKPFVPEALLSCVETHLQNHQNAVIRIGNLEIQPQQRLVRYNEQDILLSPKEFDLLSLLARQAGRVYSRAEIEQEVWHGEPLPNQSNVVDVHIANIRTKFRDFDGYGIIRTVRGIGYALRK